VAAYGFNEGFGTIVTDASGNGNTGTIGTATWTTSGKYGNALSFNGTSARVTVNDSNSLDLTTGMTLEAWLFPTAVGGWRDVIYKGTDDIYYLMGSSDNSTPAIGGTFSPIALRGTSSLPLNAWTHLAGTYDGTTMRLYVNGVQVSSRAQTGPIQTSTAVLTMGGDALYGQYFAGRIDEVRIYNRALSAAEIQSDMSSALGAGPPDTQPPSTPGNLVATAIGFSQVHLSWTASTDNVGVAGYLVERQDPGSPSFVQVGTSDGTSYNDTALAAGSSYSYRVRATDPAQNLSQYSGVASTTTLAGIAASDNFNRANGGLGVNWAKPVPASEQTLGIVNNQVTPDIEDAHCYAYWTRDTFSQDEYSQVRMSNVGPWNGVIARAQSAIDRFYMAFVFGTNDYRIYLRKDGLYYSLKTGNTETWVAGDIIGLEAAGFNPVQLTLLRNGNPVLTYTDTTENLVGGSPGIGIFSPSGDHLAIDDWEGGNLGTLGILRSLGTLVPDTQAPSTPGNLVATASGVSQVKLSWTASTNNVGVTKYEVQRQDPGSTSFVHVGTTTRTSYNNTGLAEGTSYSYRVLVRDATGRLEKYSGVASVTTASPTINPR
jgi:chitodextrinase